MYDSLLRLRFCGLPAAQNWRTGVRKEQGKTSLWPHRGFIKFYPSSSCFETKIVCLWQFLPRWRVISLMEQFESAPCMAQLHPSPPLLLWKWECAAEQMEHGMNRWSSFNPRHQADARLAHNGSAPPNGFRHPFLLLPPLLCMVCNKLKLFSFSIFSFFSLLIWQSLNF